MSEETIIAIEAAVLKASEYAGDDVAAIVIIVAAVIFALSAVKGFIKIIMSVLGFLAVLYLLNPTIFYTCVEYAKSLFSAIGFGA